MTDLATRQRSATDWFRQLRDAICARFAALEEEATGYPGEPGRFIITAWQRPEGGGGEMAVMKGRLFEKVGVNISVVEGTFTPQMAAEVPGAAEDPRFWAAGISLVSHMANPHVPAIHMNTRYLVVGDGAVLPQRAVPENIPGASARNVASKQWFGGGADLTPMFDDPAAAAQFHAALEACCARHGGDYYPRYKAWCDDYFFLKHRGEPRGAGGIFYDYLSSGDWDADFAFTRDVGETFLAVYPQIIASRSERPWTAEERQAQLVKRGRYVEFNLLYDRGTRFGLMTGGNTEAILMSLPPLAAWP